MAAKNSKKRRQSKPAKAKQRQQKKAAAKRQKTAASAEPGCTKLHASGLDSKKEVAAQLLAENDFTVEEIAGVVGVVRRTIYDWKELPEFAARVAAIEKTLGDISLRRVIARKNRRLLALEERWLRMQRVIEARAADPGHQRAVGGNTGLLVRKQRMLGGGEHAILVEEFTVDTALIKEMREHEKQAAQECGQWVEKVAPTTPDGKDEYSGIPAPDLDEFRKLPVADRIRILRAPLRAYPLDREEPPPAV